jgi:hypothetical protein
MTAGGTVERSQLTKRGVTFTKGEIIIAPGRFSWKFHRSKNKNSTLGVETMLNIFDPYKL